MEKDRATGGIARAAIGRGLKAFFGGSAARSSNEAPLARHSEPTGDRPSAAHGSCGLDIVPIHGLKAYVDRERDPEVIQRGLDQGWYEASEVLLARAVLASDDRVLELGAGMGLVTAAMAQIVGGQAIAAYEPNPSIAERARANLALNGIDCTVRERLCRPRAKGSGTARFRLAEVFWASSLEPDGQGQGGGDEVRDGRVIPVPVEALEDAVAAHRASVLVMDIEGGEIEILEEADLDGLRALIFETHELAVGSAVTNRAVQAACRRGFLLDFRLTREGVVVLRRAEASAPPERTHSENRGEP